MTAKLYTLNPVEGFRPKTFAGHRDVVISAFFSEDEKEVSGDGVNRFIKSHPQLMISWVADPP
jgi:hypothetical protein